MMLISFLSYKSKEVDKPLCINLFHLIYKNGLFDRTFRTKDLPVCKVSTSTIYSKQIVLTYKTNVHCTSF